MTPRPRVLFIGRGRLDLPLPDWLAAKWDGLSTTLDLRVLNAGTGTGDDRFRLLPPEAAAFYPALVPAVVRELLRFRPAAVVASDPYIGAAVLAARSISRVRTKVIVEVHGDPATLTRLYGSKLRNIASPAADAISRFALMHADATRALSAFTSSLVENARGWPATATFPTYSHLEAFSGHPSVPVPETTGLVFVGALERYKNVSGLAAAWREVVRRKPDSMLRVVGSGSQLEVIQGLLGDLPRNVEHRPSLSPGAVADAMDEARALVLPSWPEGLGRVVLEAFARSRGVIATNAGGIVDIVTHDHDGLLVPRADVGALADAMVRVLDDHELAARLGAAAHETYGKWHQTADDFAAAYRSLVDRVIAGAR